MNRSITLKVTLTRDEIADFLSALTTAAWLAGEFASYDELQRVEQLDWLIGEFQDQLEEEER